MNDAEKREKVIRGLEAHANPKSCETCAGEECPYYNMGGGFTGVTCSSILAVDALALLKEQEARAITRGEIIKLNDWVWVDYKDAFNGYAYKLDYDSDCDRVEWLDGATDGMEEYGKTWRCWISRPTPEQMREMKWEGDSDAE